MSTQTTNGQNSTDHPLAEYAIDENTIKRSKWENFRLAACPGVNRINICNLSYPFEEKADHTYTVTIENGMPVSCTCKSFEFRIGLCKHCLACAADDDAMAEAEGMTDHRNDVPRSALLLGVDAEGYEHWFSNASWTVWVFDGDDLDREEEIGAGALGTWVEFVEYRRGWNTMNYHDGPAFEGLIETLGEALTNGSDDQ